MNLMDLLDKLTRLSASFSQQGTAFERMMRTYLQTDPLYSERFEKVFSWMEWPDRPTRERDTGIDLVGIERDGGVCAIQCKFIPAGQSVSKPAGHDELSSIGFAKALLHILDRRSLMGHKAATRESQEPVGNRGIEL